MRPISAHRRQRGFSIIELLVSVAIGLIVTLAVFGVLAASEGRKRTSVSLNDANQSGAYAAFTLDRVVRSAGTGYTQGWGKVGGCRLNASFGGAQLWPRTTALPAPFAGVPLDLRLAPIIIFAGASGAGSDVLMIMSGAAGFGESPTEVVPGSITATQALLPNTIGYRANDLVMLAGGGECLLTQVASNKTACAGDPAASSPTTLCGQQLPLAGDYYTATAANTSLATLAALGNVNAFVLGNPTSNRPQFQLLGVGDNSTLFSYDLLLPVNGTTDPVPVAEDVRELHAVYGVDTTGDGILDSWQPPTAVGWDSATLLNPASTAKLRQIVAVRIGLVMRSSLVERELAASQPVAAASMPLFSDLPVAAQLTVDLTRASENRNQRHRTVEVTIPIRNTLLRP